MLKFVARPYAGPEAAGRRLLELAQAVEHPQGWIYVEKVNGPFLREGGRPDEYVAGIAWLTQQGLIAQHESGTYFVLTQAGKDLVA